MLNILEGNKLLQTLFLVVFALIVISFIRMNNEEKELFDSVNERESFYIGENLPENFENDIEGFHTEKVRADTHLESGNCGIGEWSSWDFGKRKCEPCGSGLCPDGYFKRKAGNTIDYCKPMSDAQCKSNEAAKLSCNTACEPCKFPSNSYRVGNAGSDLKGAVQSGAHSNIGKVCYFKCNQGYTLAGKNNDKKCLKKPIMCNTNLYIKSRYGTGSYLEICGFRTTGCKLLGKNTVYDVKTNRSKTKLLRGWNQIYDRSCKDHWYWGRRRWGCRAWRSSGYCRWHWWVKKVCKQTCGKCKNYPKFQVGTKGGNMWKIVLKDSVTRPASYRWRVKKDTEDLAVFKGVSGIPLRYGDRVYIQNQLATKKTYLDVCGADQHCRNGAALAVQTWNTPNRHPQSTGSTGLWVVLKAPHTGGPILSEGEFVNEGDPIYLQNTYKMRGRETYLDVCGNGRENCRDCQYGVISHPNPNRARINPSTASWTLLNA